MESQSRIGAGAGNGPSQLRRQIAGALERVRRCEWETVLNATAWAVALAGAIWVHGLVERGVIRVAPVQAGQIVNRLEAQLEEYLFSDHGGEAASAGSGAFD